MTSENDIFTVAASSWRMQNCTLQYILPSEECPNPEITVELTIFTLRLILQRQVRIKVIGFERFGSSGLEQNSALAALRAGLVDVSEPRWALTPERQDIPHTEVTKQGSFAYFYQKFVEKPEIGLVSFLHAPRGFWLALLLVVLSSLATEYFLGDNAAFFKDCHYFIARLRLKCSANFGFWRGLLLSGIGSYILVVFVKARHYSAPITDFNSLKEELAKGSYQAVFASKYIANLYFGGSESYFDLSSAHHPPLIVEKVIDALLLIKNQQPSSSPKFIFIGGERVAPQARALLCNVVVVVETERFMLETMFHRKGLNLSLTLPETYLILNRYERISRRRHSERHCLVVESYSENQIALYQISGVFAVIALAFSAASCVLLVEKLVVGLKKLLGFTMVLFYFLWR